ncbi:DUF2182 domain-containing protein [Mycobacteroides chelonae]|uniref:copper chaperone n=1 Tax=Mycobacteroides chelonae TaxID=1774 RepID=UPI00099380E2|nr:DUF2182 domain-containing protein [Mycobacteroides chelonae]
MAANAIQRVRELAAGRYTGIATAIILLSWLGFAFLPQHATAHEQAPMAEHMHGMNHANMAPMATPVVHQPALWIAIVSWIVMTIAMMGPATLPAVRHVEQNVPRDRGRALILYAAVWLAMWTVVGLIITLALPKGLMRFGAISGWACIRSCWAMMLTMAVAPSAHLAWMVGLTAAVTWERFTRYPRRTAWLLAGLFVVAAAAVGVFAIQ